MRRAAHWLEAMLWIAALVCATVLLIIHHGAAVAAREAAVSGALPAAVGVQAGSVMGVMRIPALHLSVPIVEGDEKVDLLRGVGHIEGTAMPGGLGTVGLAGHRDTFLRPFEHISPTMRIDLEQGGSLWQYRVDSTRIVHPEDVRVLDTTDTPELVVVTCYPFHYIGAAPLRFIVRAHLVSLIPTEAPR